LDASSIAVPAAVVEFYNVDVAVVMGKVVLIGVFEANVDGTAVVTVGIIVVGVVPTSPCFNWINESNSFSVLLN